MLPHAGDAPAQAFQTACNVPVARVIPFDLSLPIRQVRARSAVAHRAAVPKATVDEHADAFPPENEIWFADLLLVSSPSKDSVRPENFHELHLRRPVALGHDSSHLLGAGLGRKVVSHASMLLRCRFANALELARPVSRRNSTHCRPTTSTSHAGPERRYHR
jgi:hypothetical protein